MVKGDAKKVAKRGASAALTRAYFDEVMEKVFARFEQVDQRFEQVDQRFEQVDQRFEQLEGRLGKVEVKVNDELRGNRATLEDIQHRVRVIADGHAGEVAKRTREVQGLRDELLPRIETVEGVVRDHSAQLQEKADKSLEQRVEALEAAAKR